MKLKLNLMRTTLAASVAVALLASCGGGSQIEAFVPNRIVAFGDEASVINTDGTKYTVNGVVFDTTVSPAVPQVPTTLLCTSNQVWTQQLAYAYGLAFTGRCESTVTNANGVMLAANGARVADLTAQIDSFVASNSFSPKDLVTVMVGTHDIIDAALNAADPVTVVEAAGTQVGAQVVRITNLGAKVIVSTIPNVAHTPYAISLETTAPGSVARLADLSTRFNTKLRLKLQEVRGGGHSAGLVLADELVLGMVRLPSTYGVTNITQGVCTVSVLGCNMTNVSEATPTSPTYGYDWLWADDRHLGANAQGRLGAAAVNRARSNPF